MFVFRRKCNSIAKLAILFLQKSGIKARIKSVIRENISRSKTNVYKHVYKKILLQIYIREFLFLTPLSGL